MKIKNNKMKKMINVSQENNPFLPPPKDNSSRNLMILLSFILVGIISFLFFYFNPFKVSPTPPPKPPKHQLPPPSLGTFKLEEEVTAGHHEESEAFKVFDSENDKTY